ncbi:Acetylornithine deacetylase-like protein [Leptomonas seymouri]|uniref:Acetylornithine deacetylase-like protein n=1 Tax=Leptomonas seymouri TaxID=5684 RepID=A0A0N1I1E5_LEPSE|nr:Acetylornithine deacetylase-like protein [Leptomonas seymouri]|eukprot:KPI84921.1 Acetylornithine deacetylase-like protein [Leptomonas seymouri]
MHANPVAALPALNGAPQGGIVLSGHTDVVPVEGQRWDTDLFVVVGREGTLHGRGACDMRGFVAVRVTLVLELVAMQRARPIHSAFSFDEEVGCAGARLDGGFRFV